MQCKVCALLVQDSYIFQIFAVLVPSQVDSLETDFAKTVIFEYQIMLALVADIRCRHGSHSDWKNGRAISSQGILLRLEKSGNFTQNTRKIRKKLY